MSSSFSPSSSLASISLCASGAQLGSDGSSLQTSNNQEVPPQHGHHHLHIFIIKVIKVMSGVDIVFIVTEKEFKTSHCLVSRTFCFFIWTVGSGQLMSTIWQFGQWSANPKKLTYLQRVPSDVGVRIETMIH